MKKLFVLALSVALATPFAVGCADENDPTTWVKRLDDPAQRTNAIKRLGQFYEDSLSKAEGKDKRDDPGVKKVLDAVVEPLTKTYTAGGLDDKTRKDLMQSLSNMRDPRTGPALAKAFNEYEIGKTDEDVKFAAESVASMATAGVKLDKTVVDGLWACFIKYTPSKTNSIKGTTAIHDAILAVKDPSYGDKAIVAIKAPAKLDDGVSAQGTKKVNDQLEFWQTTSIQLIKALRYKPAAKPLVAVVMTHDKIGVATIAKSAIMQMPNEAVPFLTAGLNGTDPELAKLGADWSQDKADPQYHGYILNLIDVLGYTALDAARDAIISFIPSIDTDQNRAAAVKMLVWFTASPQTIATYKSVYASLPPIADKAGTDTGNERAGLLSIASQFFEPSLGAWALGEASNAKGTAMLAAKAGALQSAIKVMGPADKKAVEAALTNLDKSGLNAQEQKDAADIHLVYKYASEALDKCGTDPGCYVKVLEDPVEQTPNANWKAIKAAHMAGLLGNEATRKDLIAHIPKVTNPGARLAMAVAINHLAPKGNTADADALDKIVEGDTTRKDTEAMKGDDALSKVALMLRARAGQ